MQIYELFYIIQNKNKEFLKKVFMQQKKSPIFLSAISSCDPPGARTQDPILKRDVLYLLSQRIYLTSISFLIASAKVCRFFDTCKCFAVFFQTKLLFPVFLSFFRLSAGNFYLFMVFQIICESIWQAMPIYQRGISRSSFDGSAGNLAWGSV